MSLEGIVELSEGLMNLSEINQDIKSQVKTQYLDNMVSTLTNTGHPDFKNVGLAKLTATVQRINQMYEMSV